MFKISQSAARYTLVGGVCLILALQAGASRILDISEQQIGMPGLRAMPAAYGPWKLVGEQSLDATTVAYLKPDEYILRDYASPRSASTLNLFVAFFKSLQNNYGPHSPRICLPGAGWLVTSSTTVKISVPGRTDPIPVNQYTMEKGRERILVLYWYQNSRDTWSDEFHVKLRLLPDLIRYRRSDISLVRLIVPIGSSDSSRELADCTDFTRAIFPDLAQRLASLH